MHARPAYVHPSKLLIAPNFKQLCTLGTMGWGFSCSLAHLEESARYGDINQGIVELGVASPWQTASFIGT